MNKNHATHSYTPVLLAVLAGAGAGALAGVLLAPLAGATLRQNLGQMAHRYTLLASEQRQESTHHLARRAAALEVAYKDLVRNGHGLLLRWGLLPPLARQPY